MARKNKGKGGGNPNVLLCDRGTSFGYNTLVSDFRGLPLMASTGAPVLRKTAYPALDSTIGQPLYDAPVAVPQASVFQRRTRCPRWLKRTKRSPSP